MLAIVLKKYLWNIKFTFINLQHVLLSDHKHNKVSQVNFAVIFVFLKLIKISHFKVKVKEFLCTYVDACEMIMILMEKLKDVLKIFIKLMAFPSPLFRTLHRLF